MSGIKKAIETGDLTGCSGLNVCATSPTRMMTPNPRDDGIRRWGLGHEGRTPLTGTSALTKEAPERALAPSAM